MVAEQQVGSADSQQIRAGAQSPRYRFREGIWDVICQQMQWPNNFAASKALRVSDTTISRALSGYPGERLMAAVMAALPRSWKFEHVFELVADEEPAPVIASAGSTSITTVGALAIPLLVLCLLAVLGVGAS